MHIATIINQYNFNLHYAKALVQDLSEEQMTIIPAKGLENHPAWTLGHLISGSALMIEDLGGKFEMPEKWAELFLRKGPGDERKPDPNKNKYPSKAQLMAELSQQHEQLIKRMNTSSKNELEKEIKWRFSADMPTLLDLLTFMCINHEAMHLSQLAAWRRAMNLPSALAFL